MAEPDILPTAAGAAEPLPRCCPRHTDWATLSQHLADEFPDIGLGDLIHALRRAKDAVDSVNLDDADALTIGELIVRHQLLMRSGRMHEVARLDPEQHVRVPRT